MSRKSRKRSRSARMHQYNTGALSAEIINDEYDEEENVMKTVPEIQSNAGMLDSAKLELDMSYQRPTELPRVKKIVANFDPALVNPIKVSVRDGHYYVFDGGHTLAALKKVNGRDNFPVLCQIFHGLTYEEEAILFAKQRGESKAVGIPYRLRALEAAGDKETTDFLERTRKSGFTITPGSSQIHDGNIAAVKSAYDAYKRLGPEKYEEMMTLIKDTWQGEAWSISQSMLGGMSEFFRTYDGEFKKPRFIKKLQGIGRGTMEREASKHYGMSPSVARATAIAKFYNKGGAFGTLDLVKMTLKH